jgi:tetratricopeptide (TPR) repeat protein
LTGALALAQACTTPTGAGPSHVTGPRVTQTDDGAVQGEVVPEINAKAKLLFEDAVKALDAQRKAKVNDYPSLEKKFRAAADADSQLAEATFNLGVLAERQGKLKDAVSLYKEALSKKPTLRQAAENLAVIAQNNGDEKAAVAIYQDILTNYPDDASSRARLAEIYRRRGEPDKALELSREALFRDPKTLQAYKTMMSVYYEQKQYSLARLIALRATKLSESDPEIAYTVGLINLAEKEPAKARAQFKRAVEARADFLPAHYELAKMAFTQEDYQGAEEHLRRIMQATGASAQTLVNLGVAYKGMGQLDKAMAAYDEAQKLNGELPELFLNRGIIIGLKGDPDKAISLYKTFIARKGGETSVPADHAVYALIEEQEKAIKAREEDKRIAEETKKMEEEMKKQEAAAAEEERKKNEEELKKQQDAAKGKDAPKGKDSGKDSGKDAKATDKKEPEKKDPKAGTTPPPEDASKAPAEKPADKPATAAQPSPTPAPATPAKKEEKKPASNPDEPSDGL